MNLLNKTFIPTENYKKRNWFIIDCKNQKLGRLATSITALLKGKGKTSYHPSVDIGDHIILINADSILLNKKATHYFVHQPGRPGSSLKVRNTTNCITKVIIQKAIKGMLTQSETKRLMRRLNIYNGNEHPHNAQQPRELDLSTLS